MYTRLQIKQDFPINAIIITERDLSPPIYPNTHGSRFDEYLGIWAKNTSMAYNTLTIIGRG